MIDERALEDFIPFYIYSCLYRFGSDETRTSELLHSTQSRETGAMFVAIVSKSLIADAAWVMPRVRLAEGLHEAGERYHG